MQDSGGTANGGQDTSSIQQFSITVSNVNDPPVNTVLPVMAGTFVVGGSASVTTGSWTDADGDPLTYTYQWRFANDQNGAGAQDISGAVSTVLTLTTAQAHRYAGVRVTANDGNGGITTADTQWTLVQNTAPANTGVPAVSGTLAVGGAASCTNGSWTDVDGDTAFTCSYQWQRALDGSGLGMSSISGATNNSYAIGGSDAHRFIRAVVTADDGHGGSSSAASAWTAVVNTAPGNTAGPVTSGLFAVDGAVGTTAGAWSDVDGDTLSYSYQWQRADDSGGTNTTDITSMCARR
jgi:hypothetical protein